MKKYYSLFAAILIGVLSHSQGYEFGIQHDGGYNFSIVATPDFDATDTDISDIGFALMLPAGSADVVSVSNFSGRPWGTTEFTATQLTNLGLGDGTRDGFAMNLPVGQTILSHTNGVPFVLVSFEISNMPTTGVLEILTNSDPIASGLGGAVDSFFNSNIDNTSTQNYFMGLTVGMEEFSFDALSVDQDETLDLEVTVFPNPTKNIITVDTVAEITSIEVYDVLGKLVNTFREKTLNLKELKSGIYLIKIHSDRKSTIIKLVKE